MFMSQLDILPPYAMTIAISSIAILYGVYSLFTSNFFTSLYMIAFGLKYGQYLIIDYINLTSIGYFNLFFITTILAIGLELIFSSFKRSKRSKFTINFDEDDLNYYHKDKNVNYDNDNSSYVSYSVNLSESTRYIYSKNLDRADFSSTMGSLSIYFQERELLNDVHIQADCRLGNLELYLPKEWNVEENISRNLGNVEVHWPRSFATDVKSPYTVYIDGSVNLGNIEIRFI